jgi:hypothetical protein
MYPSDECGSERKLLLSANVALRQRIAFDILPPAERRRQSASGLVK